MLLLSTKNVSFKFESHILYINVNINLKINLKVNLKINLNFHIQNMNFFFTFRVLNLKFCCLCSYALKNSL